MFAGCVPLDFVVLINNFFSLVLFPAVIHKRGKKLISKTVKYKLDSSSKMQFVFFYPKDIHTFFWKTIDFVKNREMTHGGSCSLRHYDAYECVRKLICDSTQRLIFNT